MANPGKRFEERTKRSLDGCGYCLRLLDNGKTKNVAMPADYLYCQDGRVFLVECKATKHGGVINHERLVQLPRLLEVERRTDGVIRGAFLLQFYTERSGRLHSEEVYAITAQKLHQVLTKRCRKSFSETLAMMNADQVKAIGGCYDLGRWFRKFPK